MDPVTISSTLYTAGTYILPVVTPIALGWAGNAIKTWGNSAAANVVIAGTGAVGRSYLGETGEWIGRKIGLISAPYVVQTNAVQSGIGSIGNAVTGLGVTLASRMASNAADAMFSSPTARNPSITNTTGNQETAFDREYHEMKMTNIKLKAQINLAKLAKATMELDLLKKTTPVE